MAASEPTLHFVYNVDATPLAVVMDLVHRAVSPETYPCKLCDVTYGRFLKKAAWREFVANLPLRSRFHLRSGFRRRFPDQEGTPMPAVFLEDLEGGLTKLISAEELAAVADLEGLERLVEKKLAGVSVPG